MASQPEALPVTALLRYMRATGWDDGPQGSHGYVFTKGRVKIYVPLEDNEPDAVRMALYRLAVAEGRQADETEAAVLAHRDGTGASLTLSDGECDRLRALMAGRGEETGAGGSVPDDSRRDLPGGPEHSREHTGADPREPLGRLVHRAEVAWAKEQPHPWPIDRAGSWEEIHPAQRELFMRVGEAVARAATAEYENAITWGTSCLSCSRVLDSAVAERERAERAEAKLATLREHAQTWAALAPADDWGLTPTDTVAADCGRAILAIIGSEEAAPPSGMQDPAPVVRVIAERGT